MEFQELLCTDWLYRRVCFWYLCASIKWTQGTDRYFSFPPCTLSPAAHRHLTSNLKLHLTCDFIIGNSYRSIERIEICHTLKNILCLNIWANTNNKCAYNILCCYSLLSQIESLLLECKSFGDSSLRRYLVRWVQT